LQGLELAEEYFNYYGRPLIHAKFKAYENRIAVGLIGEGSECYGFDDNFSRDHDWGPSFCLWLTAKDYPIIGIALQAEIDKLPQVFAGYGPRQVSAYGEKRVGVFETGKFYHRFIGQTRPPASWEEWLRIPEDALSACTNGKVFYDQLGEFTEFRKILKQFYPEDIRLKKIAARCMTIAQFGQYNFNRCVRRQEYVAAVYAQAKFCSDVISMVFLLNKEYKPFFKWMHKAVSFLPILGEYVYSAINDLVMTPDYNQKVTLIEEICNAIRGELLNQGLSDSASDFLLDHGPMVQKKIENSNLRARNILLG